MVQGTVELRQAICNKFSRENNLDYKLDEVIVSSGGKQVIYNLFMATLNEGDEVIIPAPYWVSYPDITMLAGGVLVFVKTDLASNFKANIQDIEKSITDRSKWLILNSPGNPTGSAYSEAELKMIAGLIRKYPNLHVMSEIFSLTDS
jgi:aspartate aminotransferase